MWGFKSVLWDVSFLDDIILHTQQMKTIFHVCLHNFMTKCVDMELAFIFFITFILLVNLCDG